MTVSVRVHARRGYVGRRLGRRFATVLGGVVVTIASAVAMLIAIIPAIMLMGIMSDELPSDSDWLVMGRWGRGWLVAVAVTISGWVAGTTLLRRRRGMVLWLRRFRNQAAMSVVGAALDHIGRSWRVVTLDDSLAEPVGAAAALRVSTRVASWLGRAGKRAGPIVRRVGEATMRLCVAGLIVTVAWSIYRGTIFDVLAAFPTLDESDIVEARIITALLAVLALELALLLARMALLLLAMPLVGVWTLAAHVGEEIRGAETAKSKSIRTVAQAHEMAASIAVATDRVIAPRLTVLTVDEPVWRETVSAFAAKADAVIIDVSDASENLLWEVKEVDRLPGPRPGLHCRT